MSVKVPDRRPSKLNYDNNYFKINADVIRITNNNFGGNKKMLVVFSDYVEEMKKAVIKNVLDIGTNIRKASSIVYPVNKSEVDKRRDYQDAAIGLCYDTLTKYQLVMKILRTKDDKYTVEIKNLINEITYLKDWRTADHSRFRSVG